MRTPTRRTLGEGRPNRQATDMACSVIDGAVDSESLLKSQNQDMLKILGLRSFGNLNRTARASELEWNAHARLNGLEREGRRKRDGRPRLAHRGHEAGGLAVGGCPS